MSDFKHVSELLEEISRLQDAYDLLYELYLDVDYQSTLTGDKLCVISEELDDKIQYFFRRG